MKAIELAELIKQANPELIGKTPKAKVAKIIAAAFAQVGNQLEQTGEGVVKFPALGTFTLKQVEREKDGQKVTVKKMGFRVAKPKLPKAK